MKLYHKMGDKCRKSFLFFSIDWQFPSVQFCIYFSVFHHFFSNTSKCHITLICVTHESNSTWCSFLHFYVPIMTNWVHTQLLSFSFIISWSFISSIQSQFVFLSLILMNFLLIVHGLPAKAIEQNNIIDLMNRTFYVCVSGCWAESSHTVVIIP